MLITPARLIRPQPRTDLLPVCMVIPPSAFLLDERVFVTLGILKVAAVLEKAGHTVEMLDCSGVTNYLEAVERHVRETAAQVVALTTTTPQLPAAVRIVERIRAVRPDLRIVLGGPHVTLVHAAMKLERKRGRTGRAHRAWTHLEALFDVLVAGDGEIAVFPALEPDAPKLVDGDDPKTALFMTNTVYDESPWPARHLVDLSSYRYTIEGHKATSLVAQLGCPFACGFCGGRNSNTLRRIRTRSTQNILDEIAYLHDVHGFTSWMFYDDELNVSKSVVELMRGIAALQRVRNTEFRLRGFVKAELFTEEQAEAMYTAGFRWILCGFEAAAPRILENINKKATLEDNTRVVDICRRYGLKVKALMSIGHPGESPETVCAVQDWLLDVHPDDFDCTVITNYPGTPYYDEAEETAPGVWTYTCKKSGDRQHSLDVDFTQVADYYKGNPNGGYHAYVYTDNLTPEELVRQRDDVEKTVRARLNIPFNPGAVAARYEHSMGQGLPDFILRMSKRGQ